MIIASLDLWVPVQAIVARIRRVTGRQALCIIPHGIVIEIPIESCRIGQKRETEARTAFLTVFRLICFLSHRKRLGPRLHRHRDRQMLLDRERGERARPNCQQ